MNTWGQVVHIFRKDLRRFWPLLVVLVGLLVAWGVSGPWGPGPLTPLVSVGAPAALAVLAALVVQEDPAAGDRAFWVTRPLAPAAVLVAKALFVGIFLVLLPVSAQLLRVARFGGDGALPHFFVGAVVFLGGTLAMAALGASVTRDLRTFLLLLAGGAVALFLLPSLTSTGWSPDEGAGLTSTYLTRLAWLVVGSSMLAHQVLTRRTRRTAVLGVGLLLATYAVVPLLGLDWSRAETEPAVRTPFLGEESLALAPRSLSLQPGGRGMAPRDALGFELQITAWGTSDVLLVPRRAGLRMGGPDFTKSVEATEVRWLGDVASNPETLAGLERLRGNSLRVRDRSRRQPSGVGEVFLSLSEDEWAEIVDRADRLEVSVDFDAYRPVILGRLPLAAGARLSTPDGLFAVDDLSRGARTLAVTVTRSRALPPLTATELTRGPETALALVNEEEGQFVPAGSRGTSSGPEPGLGGTRVMRRTMDVEFGAGGRTGEGGLDPSWLEGAELLVLGREYEGSFKRTMALEDVSWPRDFGMPVRIDPPVRNGPGRSGG